MAFFTKKPTAPETLPVIPAAVIGRIEVQAGRLARAGIAMKEIVLSVPGLAEYGQRVLIPQLIAPALTQNWEKVLGIAAGDVVIGAAFTAAVQVMHTTIKAEGKS